MSQTLPWWQGGERVKTTENKIQTLLVNTNNVNFSLPLVKFPLSRKSGDQFRDMRERKSKIEL
jgi:hypothetical protein